MNNWDNIPEDRITKDRFFAVIEIPRGSKQKYEFDERIGMLRLDRILYTSTHYPANYGFIPHTLSNDGDALDVLVLSQESLLPMSLVECYPIGAFSMIDDNQEDEKIIAIPYGDPQMRSWTELEDLPEHMLTEMQHFFSVYKELEGKGTALTKTHSAESAKRVIEKALKRFQKKKRS
ncbi:MAG TPA: inorganic diphosphatase [Clostridiaceae bacterium]|jgi:inorganic pyrophosphatase|nr:inorganic diphosphatase [Clostridiaceae bacterium]